MDHGELKQRLAAILAADAAGYSRLMSLDERGTVAALDAAREAFRTRIEANSGRVIDMAGDSVLAVFETAIGAVAAALLIQADLAPRLTDVPSDRQMRFRIGIHLGDVIEKPDGSIYGDGVNIAARVQAVAEPGGVSVSEPVRGAVRSKVGHRFTDQGEQNLKNISEPIRVFRIEADAAAAATQTQPTDAQTPRVPPRLSIIVLPFITIGGGQELDYFVDGVTESLTTDLSRIAGSFVIARNTAFTYKGKPVDVKQIGREMNVRYVLEGSVQRGGDRFRVNVQLIDAATGAHLWAERFDKPVVDLFDMQDEIVAHLAGQMGTHLVAAEARRAERAPHPDSMDLYFQGQVWFNKGLAPETIEHARGLFDRAVALDSENIQALVGLGRIGFHVGATNMTDDRSTPLGAAEVFLSKAASLAPQHALAQAYLGAVKAFTDRVNEGVRHCERALTLDPNLAQAHAFIGLVKHLDGRPEETEAHVQEALRLSPRDTNAFMWASFVGHAMNSLGRYEDAAIWFRRSIDFNPSNHYTQFGFASTLAHLGRLEEARAAAQAGLALVPTFTIARLIANPNSNRSTFLTRREHLIDGLRLAGVPES
jgi:TolB-like protein/class 3 adenylate cyclase